MDHAGFRLFPAIVGECGDVNWGGGGKMEKVLKHRLDEEEREDDSENLRENLSENLKTGPLPCAQQTDFWATQIMLGFDKVCLGDKVSPRLLP